MEKYEISQLERAENVVSVIEEDAATAQAVPAVITTKDAVKAICVDIRKKEGDLTGDTKGLTKARDVSEDEIIDMVLELSGAAYANAEDKNNIELMHAMDLNPTMFERMKNVDVPVALEKVLDKVDEFGDELIPFGVTAEERAAARVQLKNYTEKVGNQGKGISGKSGARMSMDGLFDQLDRKITVLEKLMLKFKKIDIDFYNKYEAASVIRDKATQHRKNGDNPPAPDNPTTPQG